MVANKVQTSEWLPVADGRSKEYAECVGEQIEKFSKAIGRIALRDFYA